MASSPTINYFSPPSSPVDDTGQAYRETCAPLQETITALKLVQKIVGLSPVSDLKNLVGLVLNIAEIVDVGFDAACFSNMKC